MTTQMRHCVRAAQRGDKLAAEELLQAFMPLLQHQARRYQPYYQNFEEAFSTACHGAIHCIFQYDLEQTETVAKMMVASVHNHLRRESYQKQCYEKRIEKNIIENNTVTDLPEAILASEGACPEQCCLQNEMKWQMTKTMEQLPDMPGLFGGIFSKAIHTKKLQKNTTSAKVPSEITSNAASRR